MQTMNRSGKQTSQTCSVVLCFMLFTQTQFSGGMPMISDPRLKSSNRKISLALSCCGHDQTALSRSPGWRKTPDGYLNPKMVLFYVGNRRALQEVDSILQQLTSTQATVKIPLKMREAAEWRTNTCYFARTKAVVRSISYLPAVKWHMQSCRFMHAVVAKRNSAGSMTKPILCCIIMLRGGCPIRQPYRCQR